MKKFEKTYIGKGKQIGDLQIVRISCKIADLVKLAHNYNGEDYITFEVAKLQNPDNFGQCMRLLIVLSKLSLLR